MQPFGKKKSKSLMNVHPADCCSICSNDEWKISKSRARVEPRAVIEEALTEDPYVDFTEVEHLVQVKTMGDHFVAILKPFDMSVIGLTPEHCMDSLAQAYYSRFPIPQ